MYFDVVIELFYAFPFRSLTLTRINPFTGTLRVRRNRMPIWLGSRLKLKSEVMMIRTVMKVQKMKITIRMVNITVMWPKSKSTFMGKSQLF